MHWAGRREGEGGGRREHALIQVLQVHPAFPATESNKSYVRDMMHEAGEAARSSSTLLVVSMWAEGGD